ncbi:MAG TPA: hypothetical protein VHY33_08535, partial [Thermoanaerobaculia bacterium]|nr:hypothetical protein [Thermoanaerobaculia bacterium]
PYCPPSHDEMAIIGTVQSRIDMHCAPITTAQRKKQRIRLTNGGQQRTPRPPIGAPIHSSTHVPRLRALPPRDDLTIFDVLKKCLWHSGFFARRDNCHTRSRAVAATQMDGATMR